MKQISKDEVEIQRFTIDDVLETKDLKSMSKKNLQKHIEYLEQIALGLDHGLVIAVEQLNKKRRAIGGNLV